MLANDEIRDTRYERRKRNDASRTTDEEDGFFEHPPENSRITPEARASDFPPVQPAYRSLLKSCFAFRVVSLPIVSTDMSDSLVRMVASCCATWVT